MIKKVPSPRQRKVCAKGLFEFFQRHFSMETIKRTRLSIFSTGRLEASMTVEASFVVPLFLLAFLSIGSAVEMIRFHSNMELALCDVGRRITTYGYALGEGMEGNERNDGKIAWQIGEILGEVALTNLYVKQQVIQYLGRDYLEESPVSGGLDGLFFLESDLVDENDCVDIVVTYQVSPLSGILPFQEFRMMNRYYGHVWNGYELPQVNPSDQAVIYITENGSVYHENRNCTHLSLSVRSISMNAVETERNNAGERYRACDKCVHVGEVLPIEVVYITKEGDCFHINRECPGLKRTVYTLPESKKKDYRPCSRCGYGDKE